MNKHIQNPQQTWWFTKNTNTEARLIFISIHTTL